MSLSFKAQFFFVLLTGFSFFYNGEHASFTPFLLAQSKPFVSVKQETFPNEGATILHTTDELRKIKKPVLGAIYLLTEIGKEGLWTLDVNDYSTADNGGTVVVTIEGYRIKRQLRDNIVLASWFLDATADSTKMQTAKLQAAINAAQGKTCRLPDNSTIWTNKVNIPSGSTITGNNSILRTRSHAPAGSMIFEVTKKHTVTIRNISFDLSNVTIGNIDSGTLAIGLHHSNNIRLQDVKGLVGNKYTFIRLYNVHDVRLTNCSAKNYDSPFIISGNSYNIWYTNCIADGGTSEGFTTAPLFKGEIIRNIYYNKCTAKNKLNSWGFSLNNTVDSRMTGCVVDRCLYGVALSVTSNVGFADPSSSRNVITKCRFQNILQDGIQGQGNNTIISDNQFINIGGTGINTTRTLSGVQANDNRMFEGLQITNNVFAGTSQNSRANGTAALHLRYVRNAKVTGNKIRTMKRARFGYGVKLEGALKDLQMEKNELPDDNIVLINGAVPENLSITNNILTGMEGFPRNTKSIRIDKNVQAK